MPIILMPNVLLDLQQYFYLFFIVIGLSCTKRDKLMFKIINAHEYII